MLLLLLKLRIAPRRNAWRCTQCFDLFANTSLVIGAVASNARQIVVDLIHQWREGFIIVDVRR